MSGAVTLNSGFSMPLLGLGTWQSKAGEVEAAVKHAIKVGYRSIDCAAIYGNETEVGAGLAQGMKETGVKREDLFITSKLWNTKHHPDDVEGACQKTLSDLGLAYLDLYLIHWPHAFRRGDDVFPKSEDGALLFETSVTPTETWLALEKLVEKGLVRSIGLSNFNSLQINDILEKGKIKPCVNQVECHPYFNQEPLRKFCEEKGIFIMAYSPLGAPQRPWATPDEPKLLEDPKLMEIAKNHGKTVAQVVLRWQIQRQVIVIPKSVNLNRIEENFSISDFTLSSENMELLASFHRADGRVVEPRVNGKSRDGHHPHYPFRDGLEF
ncbi:aldo-keto reductase family 1 member A1-B-like [Tigriopus californicus]|uniref:aldo-keto reductase family 1 member A1-B-like n=1 Tax=Tigriopus californicus TaxID=6832 RepID=UPI0027DA57D0|nr:aldo-keto reductase family 1 member A1-B-like [Tigriopus californicus]XP_059083383.1 aldo-keto reductase family 1 member A1-B-like [Tigriopus californicus]